MIRDCFQTTIPMSRQLYYQFYQLKLKKQILVLDSGTKLFLDGSEITQTSLVSWQFLDRDEL